MWLRRSAAFTRFGLRRSVCHLSARDLVAEIVTLYPCLWIWIYYCFLPSVRLRPERLCRWAGVGPGVGLGVGVRLGHGQARDPRGIQEVGGDGGCAQSRPQPQRPCRVGGWLLAALLCDNARCARFDPGSAAGGRRGRGRGVQRRLHRAALRGHALSRRARRPGAGRRPRRERRRPERRRQHAPPHRRHQQA